MNAVFDVVKGYPGLSTYLHTIELAVGFLNDHKEAKYVDEEFYAKVIKAHLGRYQLFSLYYHGLRKKSARFKEHIEKYGLLENIDVDNLIKGTHL